MIILPWCLNPEIAFCWEGWVSHGLCSCSFLYFQQGIVNISASITNLDILVWMWRKNFAILSWLLMTMFQSFQLDVQCWEPRQNVLKKESKLSYSLHRASCALTPRKKASAESMSGITQMTDETTTPTGFSSCWICCKQQTRLNWCNLTYLQPPF